MSGTPAAAPAGGEGVVIDTWRLYEREKLVGAGGFGQVILVRRTAVPRPITTNTPSMDSKDSTIAGTEYVLKRIYLQDDPKSVQSAAVEVKVLQSMEPHPNIISYYDHFIDHEGFINIVMEYCSVGDLEKYLVRRRKASCPLTLTEVLFLSFQLLVGVAHLHKNGVMHRDLKPANVFLCAQNLDAPKSAPLDVAGGAYDSSAGLKQTTLKVADFGISHVMQNTVSFANTVIGTPFYIAPEIVESKPYSTSADLWAVGCIIYEIASTGTRCFEGDNMLAVVTKIAAGKIVPFADPTMEEFIMPLIKDLVAVDPAERLTAKAALEKYFQLPAGDTDFVDDFEEPPEG